MLVLLLLYIALIACIGYAVSLLRTLVLTKKYSKNWVKVQPEHYIHFTNVQIRKSLNNILETKDEGGDREQFDILVDKLEKFYNSKFFKLEKNLLEDFHIFDPNSKVETNLETPEFEELEGRFIKNWLDTLEKANFKPLTQQEYDFAVQEDYSSTLPVEVNWAALDNKTLGRNLNNVDGSNQLPSFSDYIWVYHRGVGVDQTQDLLIMEKIDTLITSLLLGVYHLGLKIVGQSPPIERDPETSHEEDNAQVIQRITLRGSLKRGKSLFQKTLLQEPTFKELVILYQKPALEGKRKVNPLYLKTFKNVPMADLELIFPENRTTLRPIDVIKFTITMCAGIASAIANYDSDKSLFGSGTFLTFLILAAQTGIDHYFNMYYYESLLIRFLYDKGTDSHAGVILHLLHELKAQEFKEALLSYFFLLQRGPSTDKELDQICEKFLSDMSRDYSTEIKRVDFEIGDALRKVETLGLVTQKGGVFTAVSLKDAINKLDARWGDAFKE